MDHAVVFADAETTLAAACTTIDIAVTAEIAAVGNPQNLQVINTVIAGTGVGALFLAACLVKYQG